MSVELWRLGALEQAEMIRSKTASSVEVIEAHLQRVRAVNPAVNAISTVFADQALAAAKAADRAVARSEALPALHGVPFTVKDNIDLVGTSTAQGAKALADVHPSRDAPAVERLRAAGAIPIGRTNLPTLGMGWVCESELWGATANPWNGALTPGASSGGEAVAVATGMSPLGLGNDGLGSLRWPAHCCGITTLKATLGRIPRASTIEEAYFDLPISGQLVEVDGPMARRVDDLRAAFEILSGPTWRDPWTVPAPLRGPELPSPVRVAIVLDPTGDTAAPVRDAVSIAGTALCSAGYAVDQTQPLAIDAAAKTALDMLAADWRTSSAMLSKLMTPRTQRIWSGLLELAGDPDRPTAMQSYIARQSLLRAWSEFQETHPLIVAPIFNDVPFRSDKGLTSDDMAEIAHGLRMTFAVNALGLPAVALPVGIAGHLPQSVQIIGPRFREDLCLDAAAALEARLGTITPIDPRRDTDDGESVGPQVPTLLL